ncbi:MAG: hypothetical protein MUC64_04310, partial [Rubritepida sp.]|nr:hypothetical protein [Rubritepida sp.]
MPLLMHRAPPRPPITRRRTWLAAAFALFALLAVFGWLAASGGTIPPPEPGAIGSTDIVALGRLLPRSRILAIAPPAGAGDARIAELPISEGSKVAAGEVLAVL